MRVLVMGGAASGKSEVAEGMCRALARSCGGALAYVATMADDGSDAARARIARHRGLRAGAGFRTLELPRAEDIRRAAASLAGRGPTVALLEGLGTLVANELFDAGDTGPMTAGRVEAALARVMGAARTLSGACASLVVVGDDVSRDGRAAAYDAPTRAYLDALARVTAACARSCDAVCEVVCGIPVWRKGGVGVG